MSTLDLWCPILDILDIDQTNFFYKLWRVKFCLTLNLKIMKTLNLQQMENVQGGACSAGVFAGIASVGSTLLLAAAFASGPVGWVALASFGFAHAVGIGSAIYHC